MLRCSLQEAARGGRTFTYIVNIFGRLAGLGGGGWRNAPRHQHRGHEGAVDEMGYGNGLHVHGS